jgi:FMN phosphatase YigB (HAD superfamily)
VASEALIANPLPSWQESPAKVSILEFVRRVTDVTDPAYVPHDSRVAVFDNDGTLWCEKPMPVQADFLLRRIRQMAVADPSLQDRQPWKAVFHDDYRWLSRAITSHYNGDDSNLREMADGLMQAYADTSIEDFEAAAEDFMQTARHPTKGCSYLECSYEPMVELLRFLSRNGFTNYIASGGGRDFMRAVTENTYGVPPERVIGSSVALEYDVGRHTIVHRHGLDIFDDGAEKAVRIWSRIGRKPILACGNSNGDIEMLDFAAASRPSLDLLILHDDSQNEFTYVTGAEKAIDRATKQGWIIVSMKNDWRSVFSSDSQTKTMTQDSQGL